MVLALDVALVAAMLGSGLVAGLCFTFSSFVLSALDDLGPASAIRAMQAINAAILRSVAMAVWFGTAIAGVLAAVLSGAQTIAIASAVLYGVGALLITGLGNVPLNERLDEVDPESPEAHEHWTQYRSRWGRLNVARTVVCALAAVGFALTL